MWEFWICTTVGDTQQFDKPVQKKINKKMDILMPNTSLPSGGLQYKTNAL